MLNSAPQATLKQGVPAWNKWREENPKVIPDLSGANLSGAHLRGAHLRGAHLSGADLSGADLRWADLSEANLSEANLRWADLRWAHLSEANLSGADLRGTNLRGTNLSGANLSGANLSEADLRGTNLSWAHLSEANLSGANLSGANQLPNLSWTIIAGEGDLIVYKKVSNGIAKLLIPKEAKRSNATGRKCRAEYAVVLECPVGAVSQYDPGFQYRVGATVRPISAPFDENRWNECAPGIHFFLTRQEAENY